MPEYYKVAAQGHIFWDEGQSNPDNKKLIYGEIKPLEPTELVMSTKRAGGIEVVSEADYKEALEAKEKLEQAAIEAAQARTAADQLSTAQPIIMVSNNDISKQLEESLKLAQEREARMAQMEEEFRNKMAAIDQNAEKLKQEEIAKTEKAIATETKKASKVQPLSGTGEPPKDTPTAETPRTQDQ